MVKYSIHLHFVLASRLSRLTTHFKSSLPHRNQRYFLYCCTSPILPFPLPRQSSLKRIISIFYNLAFYNDIYPQTITRTVRTMKLLALSDSLNSGGRLICKKSCNGSQLVWLFYFIAESTLLESRFLLS